MINVGGNQERTDQERTLSCSILCHNNNEQLNTVASTIQETADLKTYSSIVNSKELKGVVQQDQRSVRSANIASVVKNVVEEGAGTS